MKKKIEKLNIDLFPSNIKEKYKEAVSKYEQKKAKYIAKAEKYLPGGFLTLGEWVKDPAIGEAEWNEMYPQGFMDFDEWSNNFNKLTSYGQQNIINKIDELVIAVNKLKK